MAGQIEELLATVGPVILWGIAGGCVTVAVLWRRAYFRGLPD